MTPTELGIFSSKKSISQSLCISAALFLAGAGLQTQAATYNFSTLAGVASKSGSLDGTGGGSNLPLFSSPTGLVINSSGNLYVTDATFGVIRVVTPAGVVTSLAGTPGLTGGTNGTGTDSNVSFNSPQGPALDSSGNIYVADFNGATIRKITPAGVVTTLAGTASTTGITDATGADARFLSPSSCAVDSAGNVYVTDSGNKTIRKITPAGVVTTLAGKAGTLGSADGTGTAALFSFPRGLAIDSAGNLYVGDCNNNTIRKVTPTGVVTTFAGTAATSGSTNGTGSAARFNFPNGLAFDTAGNLYVADENNHLIRKITPAGVVTTLAGSAGNPGLVNGTGTAAKFNQPTGVTVDPSGNVYVTDYGNQVIRKVTPAGAVTTVAGVAGAAGILDGSGFALTPGLFNSPAAAAMLPSGNVVIADTSNNTLREVTPAGVVTTLAGSPTSIGRVDGTGSAASFNTPVGVAVDSSGNILVADSANHLIRKVSPAKVVTTLAGTGGSPGSADGTGSSASFNFPSGIAVDGAGNAYVADYNNHIIRKVTPAGVVTTFAGGNGIAGGADGTGTAARFRFPRAMASDGSGNLYVADSGNHTIRKITAAGVVTTLAGSAGTAGSADGTGSAARFNGPSGLAVDASGNVFVADSANSIIRKVTPAGVVTTEGGSSGVLGSADGAGTAARFKYPAGITIDASGNLYIADTENNTVRFGTTSSSSSSGSGSSGSGSGSGSSGSGSGTGSSGSGTGSGTGSSGTGSTGGASTSAGAGFLHNPGGIATDGLGGFYVADTANNTIKKIASDGTVTVFAGKDGSAGSADGKGTDATFNGPTGLVVGESGKLYVTDTGNATIRVIATDGTVTTLAGSASSRGSADGTGSAAQFSKPTGIVYSSSAAAYYVSDSTNHIIRKVTTGGVVTTYAGAARTVGDADGVTTAARFNNPTGLSIDISGNIYVADTFNNTIRRMSTARLVKATAVGSILDAGNATVVLTDAQLTGSPITTSVAVAAGDSPATWAAKVVTALSSNAVITGRYVVSSTGSVITLRCLTLDDTNAANLSLANGTCTGIVAAPTSTTVLPATVTTLAGSPGITGLFDGTGATALFNLPQGLVVDSTGNVYVADTGNSAIRAISPSGVTNTIAGIAGLTGYQDGVANKALFNQPQSLTISGSLYVADTGNSVLRVINGSSVTTQALKNPTTTSTSTSTSSSSGGGGGAPSYWFIAALSLLWMARMGRRQQTA